MLRLFLSLESLPALFIFFCFIQHFGERLWLTAVLDDEFPSLDDATSSVDALVADADEPPPSSPWRTISQSASSSGHGFAAPPGLTGQPHASSASSSEVQRPPPGFETSKTPSPSAEVSYAAAAHSISRTSQPKAFTLPEEEFPALGTPKPNKEQRAAPAVSEIQASKATSIKKGQVSMSLGNQEDDESVETKVASPPPRAGPRSLRLIPTTKDEKVSVSSPVVSIPPRTVSLMQRPETPASEGVSDSASVVSASITTSRPGSPVLGPVLGKAPPIRTATKSQQRRERKEALKQETTLLSESAPAGPEEHAPVIGRKKKQKKEKPAKEKPVKEKPETASPVKVPKETPKATGASAFKTNKTVEVVDLKAEPVALVEVAQEPTKEPPTDTPKPPNLSEDKPKPSKNVGASSSKPAKERPESSSKTLPNASSIFDDIRDSLWTTAVESLHLLKPVSSASSRQDPNTPTTKPGRCRDANCKCGEILSEDMISLRAGNPVRKKFHLDGSRMLITPNGDCVRGLTEEEEEVFLTLQAEIAAAADHPGVFVAPRHQNGNGAFSLIKGRAVPNGRPNIFPQSPKIQLQDPIGKLQREDALSYINQYVLPRLNLGAQAAAFAKSQGGNSRVPPTLSPRDAAAASLNSLAPYFYGPDAAAGVGIYSSSDGARSMKDLALATQAEDGGIKLPNTGIGSMTLMNVEEAEGVLAAAKKDTEKLEKSLNAVIKRNRRILLGGGN